MPRTPHPGTAERLRALRRAAPAAALVAAVWMFGCGAEEAPSAPSEAPVDAPPPEVAESSPYDGIELPPFEPLPLSPPVIERPQLTAPSVTLPPVSEASEEGGPTPPVAPLDALLRVPARSRDDGPAKDAERGLDLEVPPEGEVATPGEPGTLDRLRKRVHVDRRSDAIGPKGPRQGRRTETEAGIEVPLDADVSIQGGVRVDERDEPGVEAPERKSTPRVGVEVRF